MMLENYFLIVFAFVWIVISIIQDLRKREVANWLNFSLIAVALAYRALVSILFWDYRYFLFGLLGFGIFFLLANLFYYSRVFAGGDAKLLMGLGTVLPFSLSVFGNFQIFIYFLILLMLAGSVYGLVYSVTLAYGNRRKFGKEFFKQFRKNRKIFQIFIVVAALILILSWFFGTFLLVWFSIIALIFPLLYIYARAIEESCMVKKVDVRELTEGDWLYEEIKVGKKTVKPNWEGLTNKELKMLQRTKRKVLIKQGIPFTPSFLFAFIALIWMLRYPYWSFW